MCVPNEELDAHNIGCSITSVPFKRLYFEDENGLLGFRSDMQEDACCCHCSRQPAIPKYVSASKIRRRC